MTNKINSMVFTTLCSLFLGSALPAQAGQYSVRRSKGKAEWPSKTRIVNRLNNKEDSLRKSLDARGQLLLDRGIVWHASGALGIVLRLEDKKKGAKAVKFYHPFDSEGMGQRKSKVRLPGKDKIDVKSIARHFERISEFLSDIQNSEHGIPELPLAEDISFDPKAYTEKGEHYPTLETPWMDGDSLQSLVEKYVGAGNHKDLLSVAETFRALMQDMKAVGFAHGDLHPENIRFEPDPDDPSISNMKLIDFDASFTPSMKGTKNPEIGSPFFQHPNFHFPKETLDRDDVFLLPRPFDANIDHFSAIVIYLSLIAIADNPRLFKKYFNYQTNLIFDPIRDFIQPDDSPLFQELLTSKNKEVRQLSYRLVDYVLDPPEKVPTLEKALDDAE